MFRYYYCKHFSGSKCVTGKYNDVIGLNVNVCKNCPINTYNDETGLDALNDCKSCGVGLFSNDQGSVSNSVCTQCQTGKKQPSAKGSCQDCSIGKHQDERGSASCKDCNIGLYASIVGREICSNCQAGKVSTDPPRTSCKDCIQGKYNMETGQSLCKDCAVGLSQPLVGSFTPCDRCIPGKSFKDHLRICIQYILFFPLINFFCFQLPIFCIKASITMKKVKIFVRTAQLDILSGKKGKYHVKNALLEGICRKLNKKILNVILVKSENTNHRKHKAHVLFALVVGLILMKFKVPAFNAPLDMSNRQQKKFPVFPARPVHT